MTKTPPPTDAYDIPPGAALAHGCCSGWRPARRQPTAEIIELPGRPAQPAHPAPKNNDDRER